MPEARRHDATAEQARMAAHEAAIRADELHEQLRSGAGSVHGSTPEQLAAALRRAEAASARATSSLRRAVEAKLAAAEAHDGAARQFESRTVDGGPHAVENVRQAEYHRLAAAKAREAAQAELDGLEELS